MIRRWHLFIPRIPLSALRCRLLGQLRPLSASTSSGKEAAPPPATVDGDVSGVMSREEAYRQIHNLDFMKAAKILFTTPPKRKQFGFDFHLVQFFFACMPSLAVYLVAQYARYEIRRMEAEAEVKKKLAEEAEEKAREEEKAKEAELRSLEDEPSDSELSKVMVRLDALEEVVKEIVDEKKRTPSLDSENDRKSDNNSDPQAKSRAIEPKPELNKETAVGSGPLTGGPSEKENKQNGR